MLTAYAIGKDGPKPLGDARDGHIPDGAGWVDLFNPTREEEAAAEQFLGVEIPTREEAQEIEFSSRFYAENGGVFMTISVLAGVDAKKPALTPVTFALTRERIITVRYEEFRAFKQFLARADKPEYGCQDAPGVFFSLVEAIIDRSADVVEGASAEVDRINHVVFSPIGIRKHRRRLDGVITEIGYDGDVVSKARESLSSIERLLQFVGSDRVEFPSDRKLREGQLKLLTLDVRSLTDQLAFLSNKLGFLMDATLGLISVDQNEVIRLLTVVATAFFPPTLIGTIYGMNFDFMPETQWTFGYPLAIGAMLLSAILPILYFKRRGWF